MDNKPLNLATVGYVFGLEPKSIYSWYRNILSGFAEEVSSGEFHKYDMKHSDSSTLPVPILKPEHTGTSMVLDENMTNDQMYTILSNRETKKIALLAQTLQLEHLCALTRHFGDSAEKGQLLNSDMSPVYLKFCRTVFPNAMLTADKFHVISQVLESPQAVRLRLKAQELAKLPTKKRKARQQSQETEHAEEGKRIETRIEMLSRCRYLLLKRAKDWWPWQAVRAKQLFALFPKLHHAYKLVEQLRDWYGRTNIGKTLMAWRKPYFNGLRMLRLEALLKRKHGL
ncbi:MAG TPA: hypothetical protein ENN24_06890 [Bacteroidetes bacterium]|nr:hypothetical protein [Bacteroidota bacterium]